MANIQLWTDLMQLKGETFNLPLMKISAYHKAHGDSVNWFTPLIPCDRLYCSKIFSHEWTRDIENYRADEIIRGGTGYDYSNKLPFDIEHVYPDYSIYPHIKNTAIGFLTRGCPNKCAFCCVHQKEGTVSIKVAELEQFYRDQENITLFDPNILACKDREQLLMALAATGAVVKFEQGLDSRFINADVIGLLKRIKINDFYLAWDLVEYSEMKKRGMLLLRNAYKEKNYSQFCVYVLVNFNTEWAFDTERVDWLKANGLDPYIMVFNKWECMQYINRNGKRIKNPLYIPGKDKYLHLQRAVNNKRIFRSIRDLNEYKPLMEVV